jgi:hypothetical protein
MSLIATPYGMRPIGTSASSPYSGGTVRQYRITANNTYALYSNWWCTMNAGKVDGPSAAAPVSKLDNVAPSATQSPLGIVTGVQYTDPTLKYTLFASYLPAAAVTAGYTNIIVSVIVDSDQLYMIQADGAITQASIGLNLDMSVPSGNALTGYSTGTAVSATVAATLTFPLRIVDLVNQNSLFGGGRSAPGDAYTDCIVRWNNRTLTTEIQTGI